MLSEIVAACESATDGTKALTTRVHPFNSTAAQPASGRGVGGGGGDGVTPRALLVIPGTMLPRNGNLSAGAALKNLELALAVLRARPRVAPRHLWSSAALRAADPAAAWELLEDTMKAFLVATSTSAVGVAPPTPSRQQGGGGGQSTTPSSRPAFVPPLYSSPPRSGSSTSAAMAGRATSFAPTLDFGGGSPHQHSVEGGVGGVGGGLPSLPLAARRSLGAATLVDLGAVLVSEVGGGVGGAAGAAQHPSLSVAVRPSRAAEHAPGYAPTPHQPRFVLAPNMGSTVDARAVRALLATPRADVGRTLGGDGNMSGATDQAMARAAKSSAQGTIRNLAREPEARATSLHVGSESFPPVSLAEALRVRSWLQRLGLGELLPGNAALPTHSLESSLLNGVLLCALARTLAPDTPPLGGATAATRRRPFLRPTCFAEARANVEAALDVFRVSFASSAAAASGASAAHDDGTLRESTAGGSPCKSHGATRGSVPSQYLACGEEIAVGGNTDAAWGLLAHVAAACAWHDITTTSTTTSAKRPITPLRARAPAGAARQGALMSWLTSTTALDRAGVPADAAALGGDVGSLDPVLAQLCDGTILCALAVAAGGSVRGVVPVPRTRAIAASNIEKGLAALRALPHMPLRTLASPTLPTDIFAGKIGPICDLLEELTAYWDSHVAVDAGRGWKEAARDKGWAAVATLPPQPRAVSQASLPSTPVGTRSPRSRTPSAPATPQGYPAIQSTPPRGTNARGGGDLDSSFTRSAPPSPRPPTVAPLVRVPARTETPLSPLVAVTERVLRDAAAADALRAAEAAAHAARMEDAPVLSDALLATLSRLEAAEGAPLPIATLAAWFRALKITVHDPGALAHDGGRAREWEDGRLLCDLVCAVTREAVPGADARRAPPRTAAAKTANVRRALEALRKEHDMPLDLLWAEREILGGSAPVLRRLLTQVKRHVKH